MQYCYDAIIIGAGAVGCALARELSRYELTVAVLEKNSDVAGETSGRNSAVVHAGFNNRPGSLMASLCVEGSEGFGQLCRQLDVPFRETGKLVLGFNGDDIETLERLLAQGQENGCRDLQILRRQELQALLADLGMTGLRPAEAALWSPHTGITNPFLYCVALAENAHENGAEFFLDTEVTGIEAAPEGSSKAQEGGRFCLKTQDGKAFRCCYLINCAGLQADRIARMAGTEAYRIYPCRGEYYILDRQENVPDEGGCLLQMPVYPAPQKKAGGLGVHLTPTTGGNIIIGPSAEYLAEDDPALRDDYACTRPVMEKLMEEACELMPQIREMQPIGNYSGIRPKLSPPEKGGYSDFVIRMEEDVPGMINTAGIESPGLTASVPIAKKICRMIDAAEHAKTGTAAEHGLQCKKEFHETRQGILRFREQSPERQAELIRQDPDYGEIVCRCQKITKREIRQAIENPLGARSVSAIKYRAWATTGRCNGGYCLPRIVQMLACEYGMEPEEIRYRNENSQMFTGWVK